MKILVTGASEFVGKNLVAALENIRDGKNKNRQELKIDDIFCQDINFNPHDLDFACKNADFVFNLAGINCPEKEDEFIKENMVFASTLLETLRKHHNKCPVIHANLVQNTSEEQNESKKPDEYLFFEYAQKTGAKVYIYRLQNLFGKWCVPNCNSAVATFCHNIANGLPIHINNRATQLELLYIDDLIDDMLNILEGNEQSCKVDEVNTVYKSSAKLCGVSASHKVTLGEIADLLETFSRQPQSLVIPEIPKGSFEKKLYSTYISYLPKEKIAFPLKMNVDERGSFTELLKTEKCGQVSINISKPGITKGQHWHETKWEFFIVVSGRGMIQQRKIGTQEIIEIEVSGDDMKAVHMLPGYTHNIINLSKTEDLVTVMWANECFDPAKPDTYFEKV